MTGGYVRPVDPTDGRMSSYDAHNRRTTPSSEAGVDYYCPIGTPVRAAADGVIFETGGSILPATGRFITLDHDDGRRSRDLHLSKWIAREGQRVRRGEIIALSGASGYGSDYFGATGVAGINPATGGPHVHKTLWAGHFYRYGRYPALPTLDFERYVDRATLAGLDAEPFTPSIKKEARRMSYSFLRYYDKKGDVHVASHLTGLRAHVKERQHLGILQRGLQGGPDFDLEGDLSEIPLMNAAEMQILRGYMVAINPPAGATVDADALSDALADIDLGRLSEAEVEAAVTRALTAFVTKAITS